MSYSSERFERDVVATFNTYFRQHAIQGIAYRQLKTRFSTQFCDVMVDSPVPGFFVAVECKSLDVTKRDALYFSSFSVSKTKEHQIDRMRRFLDDSGRSGYLAVEHRAHHKLRAYLIPFNVVWHAFKTHKKGLTSFQVRQHGFPLLRRGSAYSLEEAAHDPACTLCALTAERIPMPRRFINY